MKRRHLLRLLTYGATLLGFSALPYGVSRLLAPAKNKPSDRAIKLFTRRQDRREYLRPPGALKNDVDFIAACIGCGLCVEFCPHLSLPIWIADQKAYSPAEKKKLL